MPDDAFAWIELARVYTQLAEGRKARRAAAVAVHLAPDSRYILRSVARLLLHLQRPDEAYELLRTAPRSEKDPWLVATQIAVGTVAGKPLHSVKRGHELLSSGSFSARDLSELSSALGTLELEAGKDRRGRQLLRRALEDAHDNAVAQVEWAAPALLDDEMLSTPYAFEAQAHAALDQGQFVRSQSAALRWLDDQPFSSEPACFASFVACSGTEDFVAGEEAAKKGLRANPQDVILRNNLVYSVAKQGRLGEAWREFDKIVGVGVSRHDSVMLNATEGLLYMKSGALSRGCDLYRSACRTAASSGDRRLHALVLLNFASELQASVPDQLPPIVPEVEMVSQETNDPVVASLLSRVRKSMGAPGDGYL